MDLDARIAAFSADHLGIVSRDDCLRLGATERQVDWRVTQGLLVVLHDGVYRHAAAPISFEGDVRAAVVAAGPGAAASGPSMMRLYGVRGRWDETPEVTVLGTAFPDVRGVHVRRIDRLRPGDVHHRFGIPVLAPPLALLLLGASASRSTVTTAVHDMVYQRFTTRAHLLDCLAAYGGRGRRGTVAFRRAIRSLDKDGKATQTNLELDLLRLIRLSGLPEPVLQHEVVDADGVTRRLDLAYPEHLLDVEADGDRWHLNEIDKAKDRRRDDALKALGWAIERFGTADIHLHPARTVATLRRSLSDRPHDVSSTGQRTRVS